MLYCFLRGRAGTDRKPVQLRVLFFQYHRKRNGAGGFGVCVSDCFQGFYGEAKKQEIAKKASQACGILLKE